MGTEVRTEVLIGECVCLITWKCSSWDLGIALPDCACGFDVVGSCYLREVTIRMKGFWLALSDGTEGTGGWKGEETLLEEFAMKGRLNVGLEEGMAWHGTGRKHGHFA